MIAKCKEEHRDEGIQTDIMESLLVCKSLLVTETNLNCIRRCPREPQLASAFCFFPPFVLKRNLKVKGHK